MKIGTALTRSATRVMLLGSGELGKEVAVALQRYGVEVVAVDRYPNAPAQHVSHCAHVIDMTDGNEVKRLVEMERPDIIVPEIEAIATDALAEIEHSGNAVVIPNARAVGLTMNREKIRRLVAEELGLPTSSYAFADSLESLRKVVPSVGYPCFVKPVMSSSGKGQFLLQSEADLEKAWEHAQSGGRVGNGKVIVEAKIEFDYEITLLTVRASDGGAGEETHFCEPIGHRQELGDYVESWQPQPMSRTAFTEAKRIAKAVTDNLGGRGVFGVELFVKGDKVWFSEVSPRPHDTGMVTMITQQQSEFELHARAILGFPVSCSLRNPGASAVIYGQIEGEGIVFEGVGDALAVPETEIRLFGKPISYPRRRVGVALAAGNSVEEARERARTAAGLVKPEIG